MFRTLIIKTAILVLSVILISCSQKRRPPDVGKIDCNVNILRFEKDLFAADPGNLAASIPEFKLKYGEFFDIFNHKIIAIGGHSKPAYPSYLAGFITDYDISKLSEAVDSAFEDFAPIESEICNIIKYYRHYFPNGQVPSVITYISGFNQTMVSSDTLIGIGLDKYLGPNHIFYTRLGYANYLKQNMYREKIPSDFARAWAMTLFEQSHENTLFDHIIYQGKILYFTKTLMPYAADSLVTGFNPAQTKWCLENENKMWVFLIENKMLFKTDYQTISKFVGEAPFTKGFGPQSPGKAVIWLGYRIVTQYMHKNSNISLNELMKEPDSQKILQGAKYKP
jgi:hypothetical protein